MLKLYKCSDKHIVYLYIYTYMCIFVGTLVSREFRVVVMLSVISSIITIFKRQLDVPLPVYPWYLLRSLGILGDYTP